MSDALRVTVAAVDQPEGATVAVVDGTIVSMPIVLPALADTNAEYGSTVALVTVTAAVDSRFPTSCLSPGLDPILYTTQNAAGAYVVIAELTPLNVIDVPELSAENVAVELTFASSDPKVPFPESRKSVTEPMSERSVLEASSPRTVTEFTVSVLPRAAIAISSTTVVAEALR